MFQQDQSQLLSTVPIFGLLHNFQDSKLIYAAFIYHAVIDVTPFMFQNVVISCFETSKCCDFISQESVLNYIFHVWKAVSSLKWNFSIKSDISV